MNLFKFVGHTLRGRVRSLASLSDAPNKMETANYVKMGHNCVSVYCRQEFTRNYFFALLCQRKTHNKTHIQIV